MGRKSLVNKIMLECMLLCLLLTSSMQCMHKVKRLSKLVVATFQKRSHINNLLRIFFAKKEEEKDFDYNNASDCVRNLFGSYDLFKQRMVLGAFEDFLLLYHNQRLTVDITSEEIALLSQLFSGLRNQFNNKAEEQKLPLYEEIMVEEFWIPIYKSGTVQQALYRMWAHPVNGYVRTAVLFDREKKEN